MTKQKHTPGPLSVSTGTKWPFDILVTNESGGVVFKDSLPCHSSMDNSFYEALHCLNFKSSEREQYAAINMRAFADAHLRAAAPDLLEALIELADTGAEAWGEDRPCVRWAYAAIAKATRGFND